MADVAKAVDVRDVFVRAYNRDGTLQLGVADPDLPYGNRPVEVISITTANAYGLIASLAMALGTPEVYGGAPDDERAESALGWIRDFAETQSPYHTGFKHIVNYIDASGQRT